MFCRSTLKMALLVLLAVGTMISHADAQNTFRRHRPLRWLGQGFSDGYHRCSPGYDTSYYNPYSAHNSVLLSQTPQFRQLNNTQNYEVGASQELRFFGGVPFSVYAAPSQQPFIEPDNSFEPEDEPVDRGNKSDEFSLELDDEGFDDLPPAPNPFDPGQGKQTQPVNSDAADQPSSDRRPAGDLQQRKDDSTATLGDADETAIVMPILTGGSVERPEIPARERFLPASYRK